jgi:excisionase family DNA binding protein
MALLLCIGEAFQRARPLFHGRGVSFPTDHIVPSCITIYNYLWLSVIMWLLHALSGGMALSDQEQTVKPWYTVNEVSDMLQVYEGTVRRWIREGALPALELGTKAGYRIAAEDVEAFIEQRMTEPKKAAA